MKKTAAVLMIAILVLLAGCSGIKQEEAEKNQGLEAQKNIKKPIVYTSFYPLHFAAAQIGKEKIDLHIVIPKGAEPHGYEPSAKQIAEVENADVFVYNGLGMEPWADKLVENLNQKNTVIVKVSEGIKLLKFQNGEYDPHVWLNPMNMIEIASKIKDALASIDKQNAQYYQKNFENLSMKLMELDEKYKRELKDRKRNTILVSHAAFGYLCERYGLQQIAVTGISPHSEPNPKTLAQLIQKVEAEGFNYIFMEVLASPRTAKLLAQEAKLHILVLNPAAGLTKEQEEKGMDYISIMEENLKNLKKALVD